MKNKEENRKRMFTMVEDQLNSGMSQQAYCKEHQVALHVFQYWLRQYRRQSTTNTPEFIALAVSAPAGLPEPGLQISYPNGVKLQFQCAIELKTLERLIRLI